MQDQFTARYSGYHRQIFVCVEPYRMVGMNIDRAVALRDELNIAITQYQTRSQKAK